MIASDSQLRILADSVRGGVARSTGYFFNQEAYTASLRAVYELGRKHEREEL